MRKENHSSLVKQLFSLSLFATITNFGTFSLSFVLLIFLLPLYRLRIYKENRNMFNAILVLYVYFIIHTLLYSPEAFFDYFFYRRDGNFFATFMPLVLLSVITARFNTEKIVKQFLTFVNLVNIFCMISARLGLFRNIISATGGYLFAGCHFLFYAHNAAGGFLAVILSLNIGMWLKEKNRKTKRRLFMYAIINLWALLDINSRGSIIGWIFGLFLFVLKFKSERKGISRWNFDWAFFFAILVMNLAIIGLFSSDSVLNSSISVLGFTRRDHTIADRVVNLWPRAFVLFSYSPLLGLGFGSYNDLPYNIVNVVEGLFAYNAYSVLYFNSAHAHHTYLHVMAETGIVGLLLLLILIRSMRNAILKIKSDALRAGLYFVFYTNVFSSFTEHRFFTPSQMLPFTIILGMILNEEVRKNG